MTRKRRRLYTTVAAMVLLAAAVALVLAAMRDTLVFFYSPTEIAARSIPTGQRIRVGGLVENGSVERENGVVIFVVTDLTQSVTVRYAGLLPDLFREGQGVVAEGALDSDGVFVAESVLAKHDENYMPPEVADALKKSGRWQHAE